MSSRRQVAFYWGIVALILLAVSPLAAQFAELSPGCPVKSVVGLPCPSCGATRATLALAAGSPLVAMAANPMVAAAWLVLVVGGLVALTLACFDRPLPAPPRRLPIAVRLGLVALFAANWLYLLASGI